MTMRDLVEAVPDSLKVGASVAPAALTMFGIGLQDWVYITSAIVSLMFMIEKMPIVIQRFRTFANWILYKLGKQ